MTLNDELYNKITMLCESGNKFYGIREFDKALIKYKEALSILPSPKTDWEAGLWLFTALGDVYFLKKEYEKAKVNLYNALNCPDGITNPFVLCRLGQTLYELNDSVKAKEYLLRAYMLEGYDVFKGEDLKYFNFIKSEI